LKVLFFTYPAALQVTGGGTVQLLKTKEYLEKLGVSVKLFDQWKDKISDYDLIHIFSVHSDTLKFLEFVKSINKPVAISTIFWPLDEFAKREKQLKSKEKFKILTKSLIDKYLTALSPTKSILDLADILLPNGIAEREIIIEIFGTKRSKFIVVPNGVDKKFANASSKEFERRYGLKDFVLSVGKLGPRKNQLGLIRALKNEDIPLVFIGDVSDVSYLKLCKKEASKNANIHFLGLLKNESLLMSAYAACKVFALPSWYETPGLSALEAGLTGANVVITEKGATKEYFKNYSWYVDSDNVEDIKEKVLQALNSKKTRKLATHILKNFTWEKVAKKTLEAYKKIT